MKPIHLRPISDQHFGVYQNWVCDEVSILRMRHVVKERGHEKFYTEEPLDKITLDLGGMICVHDPDISVTVDDWKIEMLPTHVDEICGILDTPKWCTPTDAPHLRKLPHWKIGIFVSADMMGKIRGALEAIRPEASRLADISYRKKEAHLKDINKDGLKVLSLPHSHHPVDSSN